MPLNLKQYASVLNDIGFELLGDEETKKRAPYIDANQEVIYINKASNHLTFDPKHVTRLRELNEIAGASHQPGKTGVFSHGSNMHRFRKRQNTGKDKIAAGLAFKFDTKSSLVDFVSRL